MTSSLGRLKHRADIEGIRAIAVIAVVAYHAGLPLVGGGYIGVDVFFVVSGYLITWLLVNEVQSSGTVDFVGFYLRRGRRLLPALAVVTVVTAACAFVFFAPIEQQRMATTAVAASLYAANLFFARVSADYMAPAAETNPFLHTWSLGVEEQFYFAWPLLIWLALRPRGDGSPQSLARLKRVVGVTTVLSFALCAWLTQTRQSWAFFLPLTRAWQFAAGALLALMPKHRDVPASRAAAVGLAGAATLVATVLLFDQTTAFPGWRAALPTLATMALLVGSSHGPIGALLESRPMQYFGRRSYSLYLWHWPAVVFAHALAPGDVVSLCVSLGLSWVLAEAGYRWVEMPVRHSKRLANNRQASTALSIGLTLAAAVIAIAWRQGSIALAAQGRQAELVAARGDLPEIYPECSVSLYETEPRVCSFGENDAPTLVLLGDSHAAQWAPAYRAFADREGWRLVVMTKSACAVSAAPIFLRKLRRPFRECATWRDEALREVAALAPQVVVIAHTRRHELIGANWEDALAPIVQRLQAVSEHVVLMRDTPHLGTVLPNCLARADWAPALHDTESCGRELSIDESASDVAMRELAVAHPRTHYFDLIPALCGDDGCRLVEGGAPNYRDSNHLTATRARSFAGQVAEFVSALPLADRGPNEQE